MKIQFYKNDLLNAISTAVRAVSNKTTMPILECLLITANDQGAFILANDLELGIQTHIGADRCEVMEPGVIAVEAKLFGDIIRKICSDEGSEILITSDGSLVEISAESSLFRIQEKDPDQFPELPRMNENKYINVSQFTLKEVIKDTIFSIAINDSNRMMTGELFEVKGDNLRVVSLDGHRISIKNTKLKTSYDDISAIIPGKTLNEISKIIPGDAEKDVLMFFDENYVCFRFDETVMVSRLIDGDFFKIDSMLSTDFETKLTANKKNLLSGIEKASILISESDKKPLVFKIGDDALNLRVNSQSGSLDAVLPVEKTGKDLMIAFNPKFLLDALRVIDDESVDIFMTGSKAPCFIRNADNTYIYLILPVNFNPTAY